MRGLAVFGWAIGAGVVAIFAGLFGAEWVRAHSSLWFDGEVIRGAGFWLAIVAAPAAGFVADRLHRRAGRAGRIVLLGSGLGVLAGALGLYVAVVF